jgi:hypothetical protein
MNRSSAPSVYAEDLTANRRQGACSQSNQP